jgi:hypothetical protein
LVGVILGVIVKLGVILGVTVTLGVILILGVIVTLGVMLTLGVMVKLGVILGVTDIVIDGVTDTLGVGDGGAYTSKDMLPPLDLFTKVNVPVLFVFSSCIGMMGKLISLVVLWN